MVSFMLLSPIALLAAPLLMHTVEGRLLGRRDRDATGGVDHPLWMTPRPRTGDILTALPTTELDKERAPL
jgi:hypothetical protein